MCMVSPVMLVMEGAMGCNGLQWVAMVCNGLQWAAVVCLQSLLISVWVACSNGVRHAIAALESLL